MKSLNLIKRFNNISIMGKFFIPQVVSILMIVSIGMLLSLDYKKVIHEIDTAQDVGVIYTQVQEALLYTASGNSDMIRNLSWAQSGQVKSQLDSAEKDALDNLITAKKIFLEIKKGEHPIAIERIDGILKAFTSYNAYVVEVLENAKTDTFFASLQMTIAREEYQTLNKQSNELVLAIVQANKKGNERVHIALNSALRMFVSIASFAVIFLLILATIIGNAISKPTKALTHTMGEMAKGDKKLEIPGADRTDELGSMAVAVQSFRDSLRTADEQEFKASKDREEKEKQARILIESSDNFSNEIRELLKGFGKALSDVQDISESMDKTVNQASSQSMAVSAATEESDTNVSAVASAAAQMDKSIKEIGETVAKQSNVAGIATDNMKTADQHMHTLNESVAKINEIVTLISSIADQTNLLALNATIEAARAGDAGKGFAVVASEVKGLATQTSKATEDIANQIKDVIEKTDEAVNAIETVNTRIIELTELSTAVAGAIEEQSAATNEITNNITQAASGSAEVTKNIQGVSSAMNDISEMSQKVTVARNELGEQSDKVSHRVTTFLKEVSAH